MKVCKKCGNEIDTRDGVNTCGKPDCVKGDSDALKRRQRARNRKAIDDAMASIGLVKVRGAMGGTYYE